MFASRRTHRALIVLAWLVLALSMTTVAGVRQDFSSPVLVCQIATRTVGSALGELATRRPVERREVRVPPLARRLRLARSERASHRLGLPAPAGDGRRLYLKNATLLC